MATLSLRRLLWRRTKYRLEYVYNADMLISSQSSLASSAGGSSKPTAASNAPSTALKPRLAVDAGASEEDAPDGFTNHCTASLVHIVSFPRLKHTVRAGMLTQFCAPQRKIGLQAGRSPSPLRQ